MKRLITISIAFLMVFSCLTQAFAADDDFPLRKKYPDVKYITTEDLAAQYEGTIIVDVRSTMEFDVAHINKAQHVSISQATFTKDLEQVRAKDGAAPMAFYCNGHTCAKSYKAAEAAQEAGFVNVYAYDAGIFDWIMAQPDKSTLVGKTPADKEKIIPESKLQEKLISYEQLMAKAAAGDAINVDIRDPFQRETIPAIPMLRNIPLDRLIKLLEKGQFKDNQLLIIDAVGKQVGWLQYYLEEYGYTNYAFLAGGVGAIK